MGSTGVGAVLIKGGHLAGDPMDLLLTDAGAEKFSAPRLEVPDVRGTGCALSAAIATGLARGLPVRAAVVEARRFVRDSLRTAAPVGSGAWHLFLAALLLGPPFFDTPFWVESLGIAPATW